MSNIIRHIFEGGTTVTINIADPSITTDEIETNRNQKGSIEFIKVISGLKTKTQKEFPMEIIPLFCEVDDFCQVFEPQLNSRLIAAGEKHRRRKGKLAKAK